jgi:hypothetical protein
MYYVWYHKGGIIEAGIRSARRGEDPRWLHLAKRGLLAFSEEDWAFVQKTLKDAEPLLAGCRLPKVQRAKFIKDVTLNMRKVYSEQVPDPDL